MLPEQSLENAKSGCRSLHLRLHCLAKEQTDHSLRRASVATGRRGYKKTSAHLGQGGMAQMELSIQFMVFGQLRSTSEPGKMWRILWKNAVLPAQLLSSLTQGTHLHTISCPSRYLKRLSGKPQCRGYLYSQDWEFQEELKPYRCLDTPVAFIMCEPKRRTSWERPKPKSLAYTAILIAFGILISLIMPIKLVIGPASYTLGHVPIFLALFLSLPIAILVALGTELNDSLLGLFSHRDCPQGPITLQFLVLVAGLVLQTHPRFWKVFFKRPFSLLNQSHPRLSWVYHCLYPNSRASNWI